ncbi:hypothetical protein KY320_03225 [Candidatus Woesearchaeota archaeon]|nr:hypothetical protein [Candidatus Woesearchaeota archaeon]
MKRGALSIQFIFLLFIGTIAAVVIVGLITGWAFDARTLMNRIFQPDEPYVPDSQRVYIYECDKLVGETIKQAKLCNERGLQGHVQGEICYSIIMESECRINSADITDIETELADSLITVDLTQLDTGNKDKLLISFDNRENKVIIE